VRGGPRRRRARRDEPRRGDPLGFVTEENGSARNDLLGDAAREKSRSCTARIGERNLKRATVCCRDSDRPPRGERCAGLRAHVRFERSRELAEERGLERGFEDSPREGERLDRRFPRRFDAEERHRPIRAGDEQRPDRGGHEENHSKADGLSSSSQAFHQTPHRSAAPSAFHPHDEGKTAVGPWAARAQANLERQGSHVLKGDELRARSVTRKLT
jgi:hypothetical protein